MKTVRNVALALCVLSLMTLVLGLPQAMAQISLTTFDLNSDQKIDLSDINYNLGFAPHIAPYFIFGIGSTEINSVTRATFNHGAGAYVWFKLFTDDCNCSSSILDNLGLFIQTQGKSSFKTEVYGNQIQHSFGIVYRFEN